MRLSRKLLPARRLRPVIERRPAQDPCSVNDEDCRTKGWPRRRGAGEEPEGKEGFDRNRL